MGASVGSTASNYVRVEYRDSGDLISFALLLVLFPYFSILVTIIPNAHHVARERRPA